VEMNNAIMKQLQQEKIHINNGRIKALEIVLHAAEEHKYETAGEVKAELRYWIEKWQEENKKHEESLSE